MMAQGLGAAFKDGLPLTTEPSRAYHADVKLGNH